MPESLREALKGIVPDHLMNRIRAFDVVGDIAVVKIPEELLPWQHEIGKALLGVHKNIRTVLKQTSPVAGEFRTRELEIIAGEQKTVTLHRENGCVFMVDLARMYFSPRLGTERLRIAKLVRPGETVTNMFAGVGCYSIVMARQSQASTIYSVDKNPDAFRYMVENVRLNKVGARVFPILGDARDVIKEKIPGLADRVLMPLPELSHEFLETAIAALKPCGGTIHFYDYGEEPDVYGPSFKFVSLTAEKWGFEANLMESRKIRSYAPRCFHIVLDVLLTKR
ncbi:MAG: class I SAM-dependent methyltransferase family protein [Candidatus Hadarchaeales archaeon]